MDPQALLYYFGCIAVVCSLNAVFLFLACKQSRQAHCCPEYEHKYRGFKHGRLAVYVSLVLLQLGLSTARLFSHLTTDGLTWIDLSQLLVLLLYLSTLVVLCTRWPTQLSLRLSGVLLLALLEPGLLFAEDITVVRPGGQFDAEHVARVVVHGLQLVLLTGLLISEVIIQQHQLLQRSSFDQPQMHHAGSNGVNGGSPRRAAGMFAGLGFGQRQGSYQQLPGEDEEAGKSKHKLPMWRPGDSRWRMAASAFAYVWPTTGILRTRLAACFVLVLAERAINLAAPIAFKHMVEVLSAVTADAAAAAAADGSGLVGALRTGLRLLMVAAAGGSEASHSIHAAAAGVAANTTMAAAAAAPAVDAGGSAELLAPFWVLFYPWVFIYLAAFLLRGGSGSEGLLANVRDILWIPITQAAFCRISCAVFGHLLALDLNFHVHRKTGQIMRILDRGTSSIQDIVNIILFNVVPQMIDIVVACSYLATKMQPWVAGIVLVTVSSYVPLTVCITERRGKIRKVMNALDNERESRATDVLLGYETVKYFCNEDFELAQYDKATRQYQAAEYWQLAFLSLLSIVQSMVVWIGLAAGLIVCVWGSSRGSLTVGDTVLFITMMQQLYVPLTYFGSYYRQVQKALIDMENMFELLATTPAVADEPGARSLRVSEGRVDFKEVVFSYNPLLGQPVLKGVSFTAPGGKTLAIVGSTGSGKSSLLRLLLRFYDPQGGAVLIDGQDIRHCSQASVRGVIAVVPQDTVLFNDTIMYNIRYGRTTATDSQVYEAAEIGHIHQHLTRFPHGYSTRVGERGLRLSGGEKQRVAFARAVLKQPAILVLDEATSALDSLTEKMVQDSLAAIRGRCTQLIVAHRLSTVMDADIIVVLERGKVVEQGTHAQLIEQGGQYCSMWSRQQDYCSIPPSPSPGPGLAAAPAAAAAAAAAARLPRDKSFGASPLTGEVSRGVKGPLKLLLRQPDDAEETSAAEQQQQQQRGDSPADSAAATAAGDDDEGPGLIGVDSLGELATGVEDGGVSGRGSSCSGGGAAEDEEGGVRRLVDSSASIRRYHMLRRAETGTSDVEFSEAPSPEVPEEPEQQQQRRPSSTGAQQ
uniref:Uncharacterized protein n=1 Tax=Tetradesmus obliquus TaxID=3088 RepID=A0A383VNR8_TETOB|eukprot:jgi/Sobl393_1/4119/SZX66384.1